MFAIRATVEFATVSDTSEIGALSKKYVEHDLGWKYAPERLRRLLRDESKNVVVARAGNALAGFGIMTYGDDTANLDLLGVKPRYRRRGVGRQIVDWLEGVALTAGVVSVFVQVRKLNHGAIRFYEKLDYRRIEEIRGYYRGKETAVVMGKSIRPMGRAT